MFRVASMLAAAAPAATVHSCTFKYDILNQLRVIMGVYTQPTGPLRQVSKKKMDCDWIGDYQCSEACRFLSFSF
jgi:hypothetical protein